MRTRARDAEQARAMICLCHEHAVLNTGALCAATSLHFSFMCGMSQFGTAGGGGEAGLGGDVSRKQCCTRYRLPRPGDCSRVVDILPDEPASVSSTSLHPPQPVLFPVPASPALPVSAPRSALVLVANTAEALRSVRLSVVHHPAHTDPGPPPSGPTTTSRVASGSAALSGESWMIDPTVVRTVRRVSRVAPPTPHPHPPLSTPSRTPLYLSSTNTHARAVASLSP